ncbi:hypothetical protein [Flavobacterium sp.]|uniref:hypothetical protein n=1 Tax=Flavobacterium sp. TaxID=239 RepID=UPI0025D35EDE|nr:hypothetical protein [Flavobacterium sp.]
MSNILFSHSYYYKLDPKQWKNKNPFPPLGTLYAASLLRKNGFEVSLFDTNLLNSPKSIQAVLHNTKPKELVKNSWLHTTDNFGKMEKGKVL